MITAPVRGTAPIAVGVGAAATVAAWVAYGLFVPQATREKIDEGIEDASDSTGGRVVDGVGDAWNGTVTLLGFEGASVKLPVAELRSDPQLVARLVEHYRAHRGDRAELTDGRALQRVREGRLRAVRPAD